MGRGEELQTIRDVITYLVANGGKINRGSKDIVERISSLRKISVRSVQKAIKILKDSGIVKEDNEAYMQFQDAPGHRRYVSTQLEVDIDKVYSFSKELTLNAYKTEIMHLPEEVKNDLLEYREMLLDAMINEEIVVTKRCLDWYEFSGPTLSNQEVFEYLQLRQIDYIMSVFKMWYE